jgi:glycosyltransferase involved in cell wall biosynthesis
VKRIDIITNMAPHYRACLWKTILQSSQLCAHFVFSRVQSSSIRQVDFDTPGWEPFANRLHVVKNHYAGGVLIWQRGVIGHAIRSSASVFVMLDQMYTLSSWLTVIIARMRGRKIIFWGHGFYGNESGLKKWVRLFYLRRADALLLYGPRAKELLAAKGFDTRRVRIFYNSLDYDRQRDLRASSVDSNFYREKEFFSDPELPVIIYVGRLTEQKRLEKAIQAIEKLNGTHNKVNLILVGDGPMRQELERLASGLKERIHFYGSCYDESVLGKLISNADLCLSPGEVGLTAIHSLSFGTPVCTHDDYAHQMPEVEALQPGQTGIFFDRTRMNITDAVTNWLQSNPDRQVVRLRCYQMIDDHYNPHQQLKTLTDLVSELT